MGAGFAVVFCEDEPGGWAEDVVVPDDVVTGGVEDVVRVAVVAFGGEGGFALGEVVGEGVGAKGVEDGETAFAPVELLGDEVEEPGGLVGFVGF